MADDNQDELAETLVGEMRDAFARSDWDATIGLYERVAEIKLSRGLKLEATCLAARTLSAAKQRPAARVLLNKVSAAKYKRAVHYEFLARAHLDLKQYQEAAAACERAEELRVAEAAARPVQRA